MPWSQPKVYELYGPRLDNIHYVFEGTPENSLLALDVGDIDIIEWPPFSTCKCSRATLFSLSPEKYHYNSYSDKCECHAYHPHWQDFC